jgi:diguanylate cyclase (GGDEF)-like protein
MSKQRTTWGIIPFAAAVALALFLFTLPLYFTPQGSSFVYGRVFPISGVLFSISCFFLGHFSYPRIHNLKVYLSGYCTGLTGIAYFGLFVLPAPSFVPAPTPGFLLGIYCIILLNFFCIALVPPYVKYRTTRRTTLVLCAIEAVILGVIRIFVKWNIWENGTPFITTVDMVFWIGPLWFGVITTLTILLMRREFFLGGIIAGCSLLYTTAWIGHGIVTYAQYAEQLLFLGAAFFLNAGIMLHWFARMEHRIAYDPLLHIYNRDYCSRIITEQSNCNTTPPFGVAMIDIDHFKKVNDTYGHQAGDQVLQMVAQSVVREAVPEGIVCRYGGEELVVFFPQMSTKPVVETVERIRETIKKTSVQVRRRKISVTISAGVTHRTHFSQSVMDTIHTADKALYRAKNGGRNQVKSGKVPKKK